VVEKLVEIFCFDPIWQAGGISSHLRIANPEKNLLVELKLTFVFRFYRWMAAKVYFTAFLILPRPARNVWP